jgi:hypothetical protein
MIDGPNAESLGKGSDEMPESITVIEGRGREDRAMGAITLNSGCWLWVVLVLFLVVVSCGAAVYFADSPTKEASRLEREIDSALLLGSSRAEVEHWLASRGFRPQPSLTSDGRFCGLSVNVDKEYFWYGNGQLTIWFHFDEKGMLIKYGTNWTSYSL